MQTNSSAAELISTTMLQRSIPQQLNHVDAFRREGLDRNKFDPSVRITRRTPRLTRCSTLGDPSPRDGTLGDVAIPKSALQKRIGIHDAAKHILAAPARFRRIAHRLRTKLRPHDLLHTSTRGRHRGTRRARTICVNRSDLRPHSRRQTSCTDIRRTPENRSPEGLVHRIPDPRPVSASEATGKGRTAPTECVAVRMLCW